MGITTHDPGFIAITFIGTLALPRVLGLSPRRWNRRGFGPNAFGRIAAAGRTVRRRRPRPVGNRGIHAGDAVGLRNTRGGGCSPPRAASRMTSQ